MSNEKAIKAANNYADGDILTVAYEYGAYAVPTKLYVELTYALNSARKQTFLAGIEWAKKNHFPDATKKVTPTPKDQ